MNFVAVIVAVLAVLMMALAPRRAARAAGGLPRGHAHAGVDRAADNRGPATATATESGALHDWVDHAGHVAGGAEAPWSCGAAFSGAQTAGDFSGGDGGGGGH